MAASRALAPKTAPAQGHHDTPVFGFVHGGAHGAWCWWRVVDVLDARGARSHVVDLPCEDDTIGTEGYADVVVEHLRDELAPVVLVGHSLGGLTVPLVAHRRPTRRMIFLAAMLPVPGVSFAEQQRREPDILFPYPRGEGRAGLMRRWYSTCSPSDATWAMSRVRRQSITPYDELSPLRSWPDVPASYIVCAEDRACNPAWARRAARERLGVEPVELTGAGHSPFLDRPEELADLLLGLARVEEAPATRA